VSLGNMMQQGAEMEFWKCFKLCSVKNFLEEILTETDYNADQFFKMIGGCVQTKAIIVGLETIDSGWNLCCALGNVLMRIIKTFTPNPVSVP
jgi:hypothetical protein